MAYKISGRVLKKSEAQTFPSKSGNSYTRQDLVIAVKRYDPYTGEPTEDETNTPKFTFFGDRINDLALISEGDGVTIHFEIAGRKFTKEDGSVEYFNDIRPLRVDKAQSGMCENTQRPIPDMAIKPGVSAVETGATAKEENKVKGDDLPF